MKKLPLYISLLLLLTCAKEDSQTPNIPPSQVIKQYTLSVTAGDGGSVSTTGGTFSQGTQVSITATPNSGYSFSGWSNGSTANPLSVTLNSNTSLTANFEVVINTYTLSIGNSEGGSVSSPGVTGVVSGAYQEGTEITLVATPADCFNFIQWSDGETSHERVVTVNSNIEISAEFQYINQDFEYSLVRLRFPCAYDISLNKDYNSTNMYEANTAGWFSVSHVESHGEYYYPTENDYHEPGFFTMDPHNFAHGDFNNDGLQDIVITWATFTHMLSRESRYNYSILINNGDGTINYVHDAITTPSAHNNHFAYRTKVADFNGDGFDDIVSASMGIVDGYERIPLLFNTGLGTFYDASSNIEGQEDGISPPDGHTFGHDLDIGDVDGDGDIDIFTGKILLINDGAGNFINKTQDLPNELKTSGRNIWSSVIADFNNDGIEDFFIPYAETDGPQGSNSNLSSSDAYTNFSGAYSLSKNNNPSYLNSDIGFVSEAKYGIPNSKFNYAIDYDINLDGYKDVIVAVTRAEPYYIGKGLQVFLNEYDSDTGNRKFVSGDHLLPDESVLDQYHGEGQLSIIDIDNDGILDIAHTSGAYGNEYGLSFYINKGGYLELFDENEFAYVGEEQIPGRENFGNYNKLRRAIPVDLDSNNWIDYISVISFGLSGGGAENVFYSVLAKE